MKQEIRICEVIMRPKETLLDFSEISLAIKAVAEGRHKRGKPEFETKNGREKVRR